MTSQDYGYLHIIVFTYRLDKPTVTTEFEPAEVATPRRGQHDTVGGLGHFVEW